MIGTIRKHQQWLWAIIITLTIASFVIFMGGRGGQNGAGSRDVNFGSIGGEKVSKDDYINARNEALLEVLFTTRQPFKGQSEQERMDLERRIYVRLLIIKKEEEFGVSVTSEKAGQFATRLIQQFGSGGAVTPEDFRKYVLEPQGLTFADLDRFMRHEIGREELMSTIGLTGTLITPQEAQELYRRERQDVSAEAIFFSPSNYLNEVTVTPAAISQFYSNQLANYRLPERVQVTYVKFPFTNYFPKVEKDLTNLTEIVNANYERLGTNLYREARTPEEAKAKIREDVLKRAAAPYAKRDANQFATPLFDNPPLPLSGFVKYAESNKMNVAVTAPFARDEIPKGLEVAADFSRAAFNLSATDSPYAQPIEGHDGVYVIAFDKRLPSEIRPLEQIKDKVAMDYKMIQAMMKARNGGREFSLSVSNGLAQRKSFDALAADAKLKPVHLPPFSQSSEDVTNVDPAALDALRQLAFSTPPGKVSPFRPTREGGLIVYVKELLPLDEKKMKEEMPRFIAYARQAREREAFDLWFRKELERARIDAPLLRQEQEAMSRKGA